VFCISAELDLRIFISYFYGSDSAPVLSDNQILQWIQRELHAQYPISRTIRRTDILEGKFRGEILMQQNFSQYFPGKKVRVMVWKVWYI